MKHDAVQHHNITPIPMAVSKGIKDVPSQLKIYLCTSLKGSYIIVCYDDNCKNNDNCNNDDTCKQILIILTTTVKKSTTTVKKKKFDDNCKKNPTNDNCKKTTATTTVKTNYLILRNIAGLGFPAMILVVFRHEIIPCYRAYKGMPL